MFGSAVDALICAEHVQKSLSKLNKELAPEYRILFRVGLNLGDVIEDNSGIYGDGVNIAARLESIAEPGGICISGSFLDAIGQNLPFEYESMGEQQVKNISKPVRVYKARSIPGSEMPVVNPGRVILAREELDSVKQGLPKIILLLIVTVVVIAMVFYGLSNNRQKSITDSANQPQVVSKNKLNKQLDVATASMESPLLQYCLLQISATTRARNTLLMV